MITAAQRLGMMSSASVEWATPRTLFEMLDREFRFTLDVCATAENSQCVEYFPEHGLQRAWVPLKDGPVWCNPPYGRGIGNWVEKAYRETRTYGIVVMLLPARTDTQWFHDYCLKASEIRFLRGRLCFNDSRTKRAPFPSMIVIFKARA